MRQGRKQGASGRAVWVVDRRHSSMCVGEGKKAFSPDLVLWADAASGAILATDILRPEAPPEAVLDSLRRALESPLIHQGVAREPGVVRVTRPDLAEALRPEAEALGAIVEVVPALPALDEAYEAMEAQFGSPGNQGYLEKTDAPEPLLADFFAAAAEYYRLKPWKVLTDTEPVLLLGDAWDPPHRYAVVLGAGGETYGFALYHSLRHLERVWEGGPGAARRVPAISVVFSKTNEFGPSRLAEMKDHGWEIASRNAYPLVLKLGPKSNSIWPDQADVRLLTAAARALGPFVRSLTKGRWMPEDQDWVEETHRVSVTDEEVEVVASFPAPRSPKPRRGG